MATHQESGDGSGSVGDMEISKRSKTEVSPKARGSTLTSKRTSKRTSRWTPREPKSRKVTTKKQKNYARRGSVYEFKIPTIGDDDHHLHNLNINVESDFN